MALIGISGKIGSGKDTVGKYLQYLFSTEYPRHTFEEFLKYPRWVNDNDWQIKKYADKLKEIVCLLIGCTREQLEDIGKAGYDENEFADVNSNIEVLQYFVERVDGVFNGAWRTAEELEKENE